MIEPPFLVPVVVLPIVPERMVSQPVPTLSAVSLVPPAPERLPMLIAFLAPVEALAVIFGMFIILKPPVEVVESEASKFKIVAVPVE